MPHNKRHIINMIYSYQVLFIFSHNSSAAFNSLGRAALEPVGINRNHRHIKLRRPEALYILHFAVIPGDKDHVRSAGQYLLAVNLRPGHRAVGKHVLPRHSVTTSLCSVVPDAVKIGF